METIVVEEWGDLIDSLAQCCQRHNNLRLWWRGHARSDWQLIPNLYRRSRQHVEQSMCNGFMNKGRSRYANAPAQDDHVAWLFLMQHYRLPTRLLDWTESPLIALYFAVADGEHEDQPAALWGLNPGRLNKAQDDSPAIYLARAPDVKPVVAAAFMPGPIAKSDRVLAVATEESDIRQMVQMSAFTIHGVSDPLDGLSDSDRFLVKIEIPANARNAFKQGLRMLGVTESMVFPDLEHLANELATWGYTR